MTNGIDSQLRRVTEAAARGDLRLALEQLVKTEKAFPNDKRVLGVKAGVLWRMGRLSEARDCYFRVTQMAPRSELASLGLFHSLWDMGNYSAAKAEAVRFLSTSDSTEYDLLLDELGLAFDANGLRIVDKT